MAKKIDIGGELHSVATGNIVVDAKEIKYRPTGKEEKTQAQVNDELIEAVGSGGNIDTKIASAVQVETTRATGAESALGNRVTSLENEVGTGGGSNTLSSRVTALESGKADKATTIAGYGITDAYTQASGQALEDSVAATLEEQDSKIDLLNGSEVVVVADHTAVSSPDSQKIYREYGTNSYTDYMYQNNAWQAIATYDYPGVDNEPTAGSDNLVKSGGVANYLADAQSNLFTPEVTEGYYISTNGQILPYSGYRYTVPIHLSKGETLSVNEGEAFYQGLGTSILSEVSSTGTFIRSIINHNSTVTEPVVYVAEKDMYVAVCCNLNPITYRILTLTKAASKEYIDNFVKQLDDIANTIHITSNNFVGVDFGHYIDQSGHTVEYAGYYISRPITLKEGDVLNYKSYASNAANLAKVVGENTYFVLESDNIEDITLEYVADEDCEVVISGSGSGSPTTTVRVPYTLATTIQKDEYVASLENRLPVINSPYTCVDFGKRVLSNTHEHCFDEEKLKNVYNRGIRVISCSHYIPSCPRYPLSDFRYEYEDFKSWEAAKAGDYELVTRVLTGGFPTITGTVDGDINTDNIPQIANAERGFTKDFQGNHCNILGLLWGTMGNAAYNYSADLPPEERAQSRQILVEHGLEDFETYNALLGDESKWQFGSRYAFGTVNHCNNFVAARKAFDTCPNIFKAMELFNQGYSKEWNKQFRDTYDTLLRNGYRIWGTSVTDWQGDWATWAYTTSKEKEEWTEKYNALSSQQKEQYGSAENYYMETGRYKFDRGCNVILVSDNYDSLTPEGKAKDVIKSYIAGRYYMAGLGKYTMRIAVTDNKVTFQLSDYCDSIRVITGKEEKFFNSTDTVVITVAPGDMYVRLEAEWPDGDFVYSNPIWVEN